jgi:hypothetical protein
LRLRPFWLYAMLVTTLGLAPACSPPPRPFVDSGPDVEEMDGATAPDVAPLPDVRSGEPGPDTSNLGRSCTRNAQCDDGIECTDDLCGASGRCENLPNGDRCDNMVFCDGVERCDPRRGCVRGDPVNCNDNEVCTSDRCDEATRACISRPLDRDGDGDPDDHCFDRMCAEAGRGDASRDDAGRLACWVGRDCDDSDPRVASTNAEICGDMIDNNCNGQVDMAETGGCRAAPHDRCNDPRDVSMGGTFTLDLTATPADYSFTCAGTQQRDAVARFTLRETRDLEIRASSSSAATAISLQRACGGVAPGDTLDCDQGFPAVVRRHSLPPGDYFILVGASSRGMVDLTVQFPPATPAPTNDACADAIEIPVPAGGTYRSDLIGVVDDASTRCGSSARDVFYRFELTEPKNVTLAASGGRSDNVYLSLLSSCARNPVTVKCDSGQSVSFRNYQLPAGRYFVAVESFDPVSFTFSATFSDPTPPPAGDTCDAPLALQPGMPIRVNTGALENDYRPTCFSSGRDAVFSFTLAERRDVLVTATGGPADFVGLAIHSVCPIASSNERACNTGSAGARSLALGLDPGTYFVTLKSIRPADIEVRLDTFDPVPITTPMGGDTCASAINVTADRALYRGTTMGLTHDYRGSCANSTGPDVVYQFTLARPRRLTALLDSSFLNVLYLTRDDACPGMAPSATRSTCTLGSRTNIDVTLEAGTYRLFVDALSGAGGSYTLYTQLE